MDATKIDPQLEAQLLAELSDPGSPVARAVISLVKAWAYAEPADQHDLLKAFGRVHRAARVRGYIG